MLVAEDHQGHPDLLGLDLATDTKVLHVEREIPSSGSIRSSSSTWGEW